MRLSNSSVPLALMLLCAVSSGWAADFLYAPKPAAEAESAEGVLVREITVKKGDTLSHISKQYSGRGHYYPQILLFNEIRNPHRIKPGQVVRVPLSRKTAHVSPAQVQAVPPAVANGHNSAAELPQKAVEKQKPAAHHSTKSEKNTYNRALTAFKKGDCENAIKLYDDFIGRYPSSPLLPEATLNRAECYLKLSVK